MVIYYHKDSIGQTTDRPDKVLRSANQAIAHPTRSSYRP
jgi:hypothetical protein